MSKKQTNARMRGIEAYAKARSDEAERRVEAVLERIERDGGVRKINVAEIAREAGVSRTALYENEVIRGRIDALRRKMREVDGAGEKELCALREQNAELRRRIDALEADKQLLVDQLVLMEDIKIENERLRLTLRARG